MPEQVPPSPASTLRRSTLALLAFWLVLGAGLWLFFDWWQARERVALQPYTNSAGELVIPRSPDGHFYISGEVNHEPVEFIVDTGASHVAVSDDIAQAAGLPGGQPITISTANGLRQGRLVRSVPVQAGGLSRNDVSVSTGLLMSDHRQSLLGQSFLRHFDVRIEQDHMLLRAR